jgi:hypothetical protein
MAVCVGLFLLAWGLWGGYGERTFLENSEAVQLVVVRLDSTEFDSKEDGRRLVYRPVFEVRDADGSRKQFAGNLWYDVAPHAVGDVVPGRYSAASGRISSDKLIEDRRGVNSGYFSGGIFALLFGSALLWRRRLKAKRAKSWS